MVFTLPKTHKKKKKKKKKAAQPDTRVTQTEETTVNFWFESNS